MSTTSEILEIVREMGPITASDVHQLMPHVRRQPIYAALSALDIRGIISGEKIARGDGTRAKVTQYSYGGKPKRITPIRASVPTPAAVDMNALHARIAELERWKTDAIARYPDLAVPEIVLCARKIAATTSTDKRLSEEILSGHKDTTLLVRAVVAALEAE